MKLHQYVFKIALCEDFIVKIYRPEPLQQQICCLFDSHMVVNSREFLFSCEFFWILIGTFAWLLLVKNFKTDTTHIVLKIVKKVQSGENHTVLFAKISIFLFFLTEWFPKSLKVFRLKAAILGLWFVNLVMFNCS